MEYCSDCHIRCTFCDYERLALLREKKCLFGTLYFPSAETIAYIGRFKDGVRHGCGIEFDIQGNKMFLSTSKQRFLQCMMTVNKIMMQMKMTKKKRKMIEMK